MSQTPTQADLEYLAKKWDLAEDIKFYRRVANFVYFAKHNGTQVVLRLTEANRRDESEIKSELDWINYLHVNGLPVANPIRNREQNLIETTPGPVKYHACLFSWAVGSELHKLDPLNEAFIRTWGRYLGKMNRLAKSYSPSEKIKPRGDWDKDSVFLMALESLEPSDKIPFQRFNDLTKWLGTLPKTPDSYGLIHADLHHGNFHVQGEQIMAFDFDDSCFHWFVYDLIPALYSIEKLLCDQKQPLPRSEIKDIFLSGYLEYNLLDNIWLSRLETFRNFRSAVIYHWSKTMLRNGDFDEKGIKWARDGFPKLIEEMSEPLKWD